MNLSFEAGGTASLAVLCEDGERVLCRGWRNDVNGERGAVLAVFSASEHPTPGFVDRLAHEYGLKDELDSRSAVRPLALEREHGRTVLLLEDPGGEPLDQFLGQPMETGRFLRFATGLSAALRQLHERGLIHKDIKPANVFVDSATAQVWLTGFGIASRLPRERQAPDPPEFVAGTLPYMAPEQTGRMNRSIDSRSDLYSLGVTLYEMVTGALPFMASDPMEWVHCHIARQPTPPRERSQDLPIPISAIVSKLLAKTAEERYQTAAGVESDLRRCLAQWERECRIEEFPLCEHDTSDKLLVHEKLYGRAREIDTLLAAFDRVVALGAPELVLVSGYSGIGKSSLVNELHKVLVPPRGLFATGKFDQYKRDIPYATLAQAFQSLVRRLLGKSEAELQRWREHLQQALDPNGLLIVDLVPELKLIIGAQPPVPNLPPQDAQNRFQLVFRRFINVFARPEHPLALFLDDLQWLDAATLDLLEHLVTHSEVRHLFLVGAYRDNEVDSTHALRRKLDAIKSARAAVQEIALGPLAREDLGHLIADALRCEADGVTELAQLLHEKTAGNPFFITQFISTLTEEGLIAFDHGRSQWSWDLDRINAKGYTDNVVDLMVGKLTRLRAETRSALQQLACIGHIATIETLSILHNTSKEDLHASLREAVRLGLVEHIEGSYRFVHDRIHEAAYALMSKELRAEAHLRIGRLLAAHTPAEKQQEVIFEIVNQLNRGAALIAAQEEREQLAEFNLIAGKRAQASTAYASALSYLTAGAAMLTDECWQRRHELKFALELGRAQCEFVFGMVAEAEERLAALSNRAVTTVELTTVACLRVDLYMSIDRSDRAVAVGLDHLRHLGIDWSPQPTKEEARREYERIWSQLGGRTIENLIELPLMSDPSSLATLDLLIRIAVPAFFASSHLFSLAVCRAVNLSLEGGNSDASCIAYELLAMLAGPHFGNYDAGFRFGNLGCELVERPELKRFQARTYETFGFVIPWTRHVRTGRDLLLRAFEIANRIGDITYAGYACGQLNTNLLMAGDPLSEAQRQAENGLKFAQAMRFGLIIAWISGQLGLIRTLRGLTAKFGSFECGTFDELAFERHLSSNPALALPECWYWIRKLQARFFAGDYAAAIDASSRAQPKLWTSLSLLEMAEYHFYGALCRAAYCDCVSADQRQQHVEALVAHHRQLETWAENCPENFANRAALVGAEIARIEGRELDAERRYEAAILSARHHGFVQNEGLAHEVAARFYAARGFETIASAYLRNARYCYLRWGADGKVRQLDQLHPRLAVPEGSRPTVTIGSPARQLDVTSVVKASQAVSGEIVLPKLIERLMTIALENAGADRGLLILPAEDDYFILAEAQATGEKVEVAICQKPIRGHSCPESLVRYVIRTHESVILDDASRPNLFSEDNYLRGRNTKSIFCLPLIKQGQLTGLLYLENALTSYAFPPDRIAILELLAAQAAISLENTRLYTDLQERESKVRRLVDSNIIGICIWDFEGRIIEANEAFLHMVGHSRDDLVSGRVRWTALTPPEWSGADERAVAELKSTGSCKAREKEYFRKDGTRIPVLVGAATFGGRRDQGVAFVLDLTERNEAEENLRESERRYRDAQMALVHANRVTTMGQLTASIAHEVTQPVTAVITNAHAASRWLERLDVEEAQRALAQIIKAGYRASDVIGRIHALMKRAPPRKDGLVINEAIIEVIALTRGEVVKNGVSVQTQLAEDLPPIQGDRVQLQQVILNLIINAVEAMSGVSEGARELLISSSKAESDGVLVSVQDSGPGLAPAGLERLFEAFYTTKPGGLGMGLSICQSIIEAHGGRLWATANIPQGAIFQFTLTTHPW